MNDEICPAVDLSSICTKAIGRESWTSLEYVGLHLLVNKAEASAATSPRGYRQGIQRGMAPESLDVGVGSEVRTKTGCLLNAMVFGINTR